MLNQSAKKRAYALWLFLRFWGAHGLRQDLHTGWFMFICFLLGIIHGNSIRNLISNQKKPTTEYHFNWKFSSKIYPCHIRHYILSAHRQRKHYLPKYFQFWFEFLLLLSLLLLLLLVNTCSILCSPLYDSIQHFSIRMFFPSTTSSSYSSSYSFSFSNQHVMEMKLTYIIYANNNACT